MTTYSGENLSLLGKCLLDVTHGTSQEKLELLVADVKGQPSIVGRDWLTRLQIDWNQVCSLQPVTSVEEVIRKHEAVFKDELGTFQGFKARLECKPGTKPKFMKARPVPYALREKVEEELDKLERQGVLRKINHSDWAAPIVVVPKKNGVRICGDYKVTCNPVLEVDKYPLPKTRDLSQHWQGGRSFQNLTLARHIIK